MLRETIEEGKAALQFLTRLPIRAPAAWQGHALAASVPAFPLIGALIGAFAGLAFAFASWLGLPPMLAAVLAVAAQILLTGGLHEDGLADLADGFGGGRTRAEKLEIMRDPRLGSYGALALVLALLARIAALAALAEPLLAALVLIAAGAVSRAGMPALMASLPPARDHGLAVGAGRPHSLRVAAGIAIAALLAFIMLAPGMAMGGLVAAAGAVLVTGGLARRQIGGYTGDVLGAAQQLAEIGFLLGVLILQPQI
jgi:adenosylcobinamide-GDP ribazoletransferase